MNEPWGVMGIACPDEAPLLAFVSLVAPAIAMGNRVVVVPSQTHPLVATDLYQVLDTSDVPAGVVNIVTGEREALAKTMAEHDDIAALWYFGDEAGSTLVERCSVGNLKATWVNHGRPLAWQDRVESAGPRVPAPCHAGQEHLGALRRMMQCNIFFQIRDKVLMPLRHPSSMRMEKGL